MKISYKTLVLLTSAAFVMVLAVLAVLVHTLGPYEDETLFVSTYYSSIASSYRIMLGGHEIPIMALPYLGALKTWLYAPLLSGFTPSLWLLRGPCLFLALGGIYFYARAAANLTGHRLDFFLMAGLLLCDSEYLLVNLYDWGPVAIHHFVMAICFWLFAGPELFRERPTARFLLLGFLTGLVIWNKANAVWVIAPLYSLITLASLTNIGFRPTRRRVALGAAGFFIGVSPLIKAIAATGLSPIFGFVQRDFDSFGTKFHQLRLALDHHLMLNWFVNQQSFAGLPDMFLAGVTGIVLLVALFQASNQTRVYIGIAAVTLLTAWLQMATLRDAGQSMHHIVLIWPLHYFIIAAGIPKRPVGVSVVALLVLLNSYQSAAVYRALQSGVPTPHWSMASKTLSDRLAEMKPARLFLNDWGISNNLNFWSRGTLQGESAAGVFWSVPLDDASKQTLQNNMQDSSAVHVSMAKEHRYFGIVEEGMGEVAAELKLQKEIVETIKSESGLPLFEIYRFIPTSRETGSKMVDCEITAGRVVKSTKVASCFASAQQSVPVDPP